MNGEFNYTGRYIDVPIVNNELIFEHVSGSMGSSRFMHGSASLYYLSGPIFDEIKKGTN